MKPMVFISPFITFNQYQMGLILPPREFNDLKVLIKINSSVSIDFYLNNAQAPDFLTEIPSKISIMCMTCKSVPNTVLISIH